MTRLPLSGVSVCVFDAYGTLFDLSAITATCRDALGERAGALSDLWRRKQLEYTWLRSLMGRHTDFWHVTGDSLDYAMAALHIEDVGLRARLMEAYLTPTPYPEAKAALHALKDAGHKLAILSNGTPSMLTSATKAAGFNGVLDEVLSVESVGVFKPHPSIYRLATDAFDCAPADVAFMTSNGWDAAGAGAFGFRVVWVNRLGLPPEALPAGPPVTIKTLAELPELLRG
jgi:2-haloacid dehalogenase